MMNSNYKMSCSTPDGSIWQLSSTMIVSATEAIHLTIFAKHLARNCFLGCGFKKKLLALHFRQGDPCTQSLMASHSAKHGMNPKKFYDFSFGHNFCFVFPPFKTPLYPHQMWPNWPNWPHPLCWHLLLEPPSIPLPWLHQSGRRISQISRLSLPPQTKWCFSMLEMNFKWIKAPQLNFTIMTPCETSRFDQISLLWRPSWIAIIIVVISMIKGLPPGLR